MPTDYLPPEEDKEIFCNWCQKKTLHQFAGGTSRTLEPSGASEGMVEWEELAYRLFVCAGCGRGVLQETLANDTCTEMEPEDWERFSQYYPPRCEHQKKKYVSIPTKLYEIYGEVVDAFNGEQLILCAMGIRALIEGICADKGIKGKNLETKINGLVFLIQQDYVENLHSLRFLGNDAAHDLERPESDELKLAIEICEELLSYLYELSEKTRTLAERIRFRKVRKAFNE